MFQKVIGQKPDSAPTPPSTAKNDPPAGSQPSQQPAASSSHSSSSTPAPSGRNVLSSDVEIKGSVKFSNDLVVDGKIDGSIDSGGTLTVGENARIKAEIKTTSVIIYGKVHGNIIVTDRVELKANAELVGDIKAASLSIEPGAIFVGKSAVGTPTAKPQGSAPAASSAPNKGSDKKVAAGSR